MNEFCNGMDTLCNCCDGVYLIVGVPEHHQVTIYTDQEPSAITRPSLTDNIEYGRPQFLPLVELDQGRFTTSGCDEMWLEVKVEDAD